MKFGKITSAKVAENGLVLGGAVSGGALSGGIMTLVPEPQKLYVRAGIVGLALLGASSLNPKTSGETLVQAIAIGMAISQSVQLVRDVAKDKIQVTAESTTSDKFIAGMAGLACPCEGNNIPMLASPVINFAALNPASRDYQQETIEVSSNMF